MALIGTGMRQQYTAEQARKLQRLDGVLAQAERTGEHVWTALVCYLVDPAAGAPLMLDGENLYSGPHVGCYRCERPYSAWLAHRRCPGEPT